MPDLSPRIQNNQGFRKKSLVLLLASEYTLKPVPALIMPSFISSQPLSAQVGKTNSKTLKAAINIIDAILNETEGASERQINYSHHYWGLGHYFVAFYV